MRARLYISCCSVLLSKIAPLLHFVEHSAGKSHNDYTEILRLI